MSTVGYVKPPWPARVIGARLARLFKPDIVSLLSVPGRRTGQLRASSVAVLTHGGPVADRAPDLPHYSHYTNSRILITTASTPKPKYIDAAI
jgi:hypothetical protein